MFAINANFENIAKDHKHNMAVVQQARRFLRSLGQADVQIAPVVAQMGHALAQGAIPTVPAWPAIKD